MNKKILIKGMRMTKLQKEKRNPPPLPTLRNSILSSGENSDDYYFFIYCSYEVTSMAEFFNRILKLALC